MALPDPLINTKDIAAGAVTFQRKAGQSPTGSASERVLDVIFPTVNVPVPVLHGLGKVPTQYVVISVDRAARIYNDRLLPCDRRVIVLKCDTANTRAQILVR